MLLMASVVQIAGCYLTFIDAVNLLGQTLYRVSQSFTMVIYNSMVCRMCYIYAEIVTAKASEAPIRTRKL